MYCSRDESASEGFSVDVVGLMIFSYFRFGAPAVTQWVLHLDDYVPNHLRPWENEALNKTMERANEYFKRGSVGIFTSILCGLLYPIGW